MKTLYYNAAIFTSCEDLPYAQAMLVNGRQIEAVGSFDQLLLMTAGQDLEKIDLGGRRVLPGLIDSHMHGLVLADYSKQISCLPPKINSIAELIEAIRVKAGEKAFGEWILGWGYDEGKLSDRRPPDRYDLDQGSRNHPIFLARTCVHIASVNSRALELAGITRDTPDPEGGHIVRDANGEPTGILQENARNLVLRIMPERSAQEKARNVVGLGRLLLSQGIIAFSDMGSFDPTDCYEDYLTAAKNGLRQDVAIYYFWDQVRKNGSYTLTEESLNPGQQIHVAGLKLIGDGSISGHTAWVDTPYLGTEDCGICELDQSLFEDALSTAQKNHCQLAIHAMGGRTIRKVLDLLQGRSPQAGHGLPQDQPSWTRPGLPSVRLEHITEPDPASIRQAAEKGIWFSMQPIFQYSEIESYLTNLGPARTRQTYPVRTLLEAGVNLSLSTDAPATSWAVPSDPWTNLKAAVTRIAYDGTDCGQNQRIDLETAICLYTKKAAEICGFDGLGQIAPGYRASFIVLDQDILQAEPDNIDQTRVAQTYIDGALVYEMP